MGLSIDSQCLLCHLKRNIELVRPLGTEAETMAFARELMKLYLTAPEGVSSVWFGPQVADLLCERYGLPMDRYKEEKAEANRFVLERMDLLREKAASASDPVFAALQLAVLGNYLDFSALQDQVSFEALEEMIASALDMDLPRDTYEALCRDLETGRKLLYITDNAGEIGFDRVLAEEIQKKYPRLSITFLVRGGIAQNDATEADARAMGIPFPVIGNGNRIAGTQMDQLSQEADRALQEADVVIAKGMANAETMLGCGLNVYYAFLIKCQRFADIFKKPMLTPMLVQENAQCKVQNAKCPTDSYRTV